MALNTGSGRAPAPVFLGASPSFRWEMHSRNNLAVANGADADVEIFEAEPRVGTRITVFDIDPSFDLVWDPSARTHVALEARLKELLAANDLPGIELVLNGQSVPPMFSRRDGSRIRVDGDWGDGSTARVKAYRRSDRHGSYWIRRGGQLQFKSPSGGSLGADVVIDLTTSSDPVMRVIRSLRHGTPSRAMPAGPSGTWCKRSKRRTRASGETRKTRFSSLKTCSAMTRLVMT